LDLTFQSEGEDRQDASWHTFGEAQGEVFEWGFDGDEESLRSRGSFRNVSGSFNAF